MTNKENLNKAIDNDFNKKRNYLKIVEKQERKKSMNKVFKHIFAPVMALVVIVGGIVLFNSPSSYVSIDINPSIMLTVNKLDKVIKVDSLNSDAKKVIEGMNLYGMDVSDATIKITSKATELGYIDNEIDNNVVLVSTYCDNSRKQDKLQQKLHEKLNKNLNSNGIGALIIDMELTEEDAKKANEYGVSEAKILFVNKAIEENPELKFEDLVYLPAREIAKYIDEYESLNIGNQHQNVQGNQNKNGQGSQHQNGKKNKEANNQDN